MDENIEGLDSTNQEGGTGDPNDQQNTEVLAQKNKELFARAKKAEEEAKTLKAKLQELEPKVPKKEEENVKPVSSQQSDFGINDFLEMRKSGLSDQEIADVVSEAKTLGTIPARLMTSESFKAGLEARRQKKQVEQTTLPPSSRVAIVQNKTWDELSPEERKKDENIAKYFQSKTQPRAKTE